MNSEDGVGSPISQRHDYPSISRPEQSAAATQQSPTEIEQARLFLQQLYNPQLRAQDFDLEKPFICRTSALEWLNLREEFNLDDVRWPRFSYNSAISTLKIYAMSSFIHEITINFFSRHFVRLFDQAFSQSRRDKIEIFTGLQMDGFTEEYQFSEKVPDIGIFMRIDDDAQGEHDTPNELKWALEVGFSEKYDDLREDLKLWLVGQPTCSMAVLINITESPPYRCPLDFDLDLCDQLNIPQNPSQIIETDFTRQGEYGPVTFKGHQWTPYLLNFNSPTFSLSTILK
ncbi:hypothetical protein LTS15_010076 [Exophiala xenobiotica]|nr:hypothetical protein LTS15_010076 [Exophiala xenobiotica]